MLVVIAVVVVIAAVVAAIAWIDYRQSKQSVQRGVRVSTSASRMHDARRSARSMRARSRRLYR